MHSDVQEATIWKFVVRPWQTHMDMPQGARVLHAHEQHGELCLWAEVDADAPMVLRKVLAIPTGGRTTSDLTYIGTTHIAGTYGPLVFHVYDGGETLLDEEAAA